MLRLLTLLVTLIGAPIAAACCMVPRDYAGDVDQARQDVVIVHRDGHQEMAIRVLPYFRDAKDNPAQLTWIITLPSTPTGFRAADPAVFEAGRGLHDKLFGLARQQWEARTNLSLAFGHPASNGSAAGADGAAGGLDIGPPVQVGPYTVTPVKASGVEALAELNAYLSARGFPTEDADHLKYFVESNFTFLCVLFTPPAGRAAQLELPALQVGFDTPAAYYPGKFSSRQGNFGLSLTMISDKPLEMTGLMLAQDRLKAADRQRVQLFNLWSVKPLPEALATVAGKGAEGVTKWYVNSIESPGFNPTVDGKPAISTWKDDVFFATGGPADELPGFWYYGDIEIGFAERMFREHALAIFFLGGPLIFLVLVLKGRQNRKRLQAETASSEPGK